MASKTNRRHTDLRIGGSVLLACALLMSLLLGCAKRGGPAPDVASTRSQRLYLKSQRDMARGEYKQAYHDYRKAVAGEASLANASHLSSILYAWVTSQSEDEDVPLLNAQKLVWLKPQQFGLRGELLLMAVDSEKGTIHAFGLGTAPMRASIPAQRRLMARKAAIADSKAWVARLARWAEDGVKCPFDVSQTAVGVETVKEFWLADTIYVVKVRAPINCLG